MIRMSTAALPTSFKKLVCQKLTTNFEEAVHVVTANVPSLKANEVLVKNRFVGINASDINYTAGRYAPDVPPPFDTGFEGVGEIVAKGSGAVGSTIGQAVGYMSHGAFSEYKILETKDVIPVPSIKAEYIPLFVSGLTASIALDKVANLKASDTVLVTAAAGGTGQFAVQWAKNKGCKTVIGTCSTDDKVAFLKSIGCDRAINYKKENLDQVLQKEFPQGVDVVYESVGGTTFDACIKNLAINGRLVIIGMVGAYESGNFKQEMSALPMMLLKKSASVCGFFLPHYHKSVPDYLRQLIVLYETGKITSAVDLGEGQGKRFSGIEDIIKAVKYLFSQQSKGKVVVELNSPSTQSSKV